VLAENRKCDESYGKIKQARININLEKGFIILFIFKDILDEILPSGKIAIKNPN